MGDNDTPGVMDDVLMAAPAGGALAPSGADALEGRALVLRAKLMDKIRTEGTEDHARQAQVRRAHDSASRDAMAAEKDAAGYHDRAKEHLDGAKYHEAEAKKYQSKGDEKEAEEHREIAMERRAEADRSTEMARLAQVEAQRHRAEEARLVKERARVEEESVERMVTRDNAERAIDQLEDKARLLRTAETERKQAELSEEAAARYRAEGNTKAADSAARSAAKDRADAEAAQKAADAKHVDEASLEKAGLVETTPAFVPPGAPVDTPLAQAAPDDDVSLPQDALVAEGAATPETESDIDVTGATQVEAAAADNGDAIAVAAPARPDDQGVEPATDPSFAEPGFETQPAPEVALAPEPQPEVTIDPIPEPEPEPESVALADDGGSVDLDQPIG